MDYTNVPTTVFTPLEYSCCGYSEESAIETFDEENVEVYHSFYPPLEWQYRDERREDMIYAKVICDKTRNEQVIGAHYLGPNAGEVMQGFAVAIKAGATKEIFDDTVGIHPTNAEELTILKVSKSSGADAGKGGC
jgi:thioredoxin reductase (NADPH)